MWTHRPRIKALRVRAKINKGNRAQSALPVFVLVDSPVIASVLEFADLDHVRVGTLESEFHHDGLAFGWEPEFLQDEVDQLGRTVDKGLALDAVCGIVEHPDAVVFVERQAHGGWGGHG